MAMGAVVDGATPIVVRNDDVIRIADVGEAEFNAARDAELAEIERRRRRYLGDRERADVAGRTAIVIDDGIATGATIRAALRATRMRKPKKLVVAVPVAPTESRVELRGEADDIVCVEWHKLLRRHRRLLRGFPAGVGPGGDRNAQTLCPGKKSDPLSMTPHKARGQRTPQAASAWHRRVVHCVILSSRISAEEFGQLAAFRNHRAPERLRTPDMLAYLILSPHPRMNMT